MLSYKHIFIVFHFFNSEQKLFLLFLYQFLYVMALVEILLCEGLLLLDLEAGYLGLGLLEGLDHVLEACSQAEFLVLDCLRFLLL